ncbi:MAG: MBL fold metallo-hydrolase [Myxococcota bacterium]
MKTLFHLSDQARLRVVYQDESVFGSALGPRADETVRQLVPEIVTLWKHAGLAALVARSEEMLLDARARAARLGGLYVGPQSLDPRFIFPEPGKVRPAALEVSFEDPAVEHTLALEPSLAAELASWIGAWQRKATRPEGGPALALFERLVSIGALLPGPAPELPRPSFLDDEATFVGHAALRFRADAEGGGLLFDPWLFPAVKAGRHPAGLAPLGAHALWPSTRGIALTHSHPDHYDPGTLLRFGAEVPIWVPAVERESVLAIDMAARLRELGFKNVTEVRWGDAFQVGQLKLSAMPFYGEQPATDEVLHPEVRNQGVTWMVESGERRSVLLVDSGRDPLGDPRSLARQMRAKRGPIDVLFAGCRGFALYPVHFLFSSVARFLPFVPPSLFGVRQRIMNDSQEALDVAELWGAGALVPYADGGAPWYWEAGLGPRLDGQTPLLVSVDPPPEHTAQVRAERSASPRDGLIASPVETPILRPGEGFRLKSKGISIERRVEWPYPQPGITPAAEAPRFTPVQNPDLLPGGETVPVIRKKVLLRLLGREKIASMNLEPTEDEVAAFILDWRHRFGLTEPAEMQRYLSEESLSVEGFLTVMRDFARVARLEQVMDAEIRAGIDDHDRINRARVRLKARVFGPPDDGR